MMFTAFLIGIGLSMDAFSVSITNGMNMKRVEFKDAFKIALFYGIFQFIMPVIGFFAAGIFKSYIEAVDHWVAFLLLAFIGIKMIIEAFDKKEEEKKEKNLSIKVLTLQAIATSIDALAVGISFAALNTPIWSSSFIIGMTTFVLCFGAVYIGKTVGKFLAEKAEIFGGIILLGIGIKILAEHLFF